MKSGGIWKSSQEALHLKGELQLNRHLLVLFLAVLVGGEPKLREVVRHKSTVLGEVALMLRVPTGEGEAILQSVDEQKHRHHGRDRKPRHHPGEEGDVDFEAVRAEAVGGEHGEADLVESLALLVEEYKVGLLRAACVHADAHVLEQQRRAEVRDACFGGTQFGRQNFQEFEEWGPDLMSLADVLWRVNMLDAHTKGDVWKFVSKRYLV